MFTFCVDQVSKLEYKPDENDSWRHSEKYAGRQKKKSSPAMLEQHSAMLGHQSSKADGRPVTNVFGRTKKVSAPPSSQIEAVLAAAAHIREERQRKRSATSQIHTLHQNSQQDLLNSYQDSSSTLNHHPHSHQKPHQQTTNHHPFSRSPLFQLYAHQQSHSPSSTHMTVQKKHSDGHSIVENITEKSKLEKKGESLGAQLDAALAAVARRRREAIGSKVLVASAREGRT